MRAGACAFTSHVGLTPSTNRWYSVGCLSWSGLTRWSYSLQKCSTVWKLPIGLMLSSYEAAACAKTKHAANHQSHRAATEGDR